MPIKSKNIFVAVSDPGSDQSLFYRMYRLVGGKGHGREQDLTPALKKVATELEQYGAQMRRQQDHIDEIKRMCCVPITP